MDTLDLLYEKYNILNDAGAKANEHESDYMFIMEAVKGGSNEKRLASQFIAKFFKHFPSQSERAIDSIVDLLEDEDVMIRKQAIRDLPTICKESPEFVGKITDLLAQLLVGDDQSELQIVNSSLLILFRLNPKSFLQGLFAQIEVADELTREKAIRFLATKVRTASAELWTKEVEETLLQLSRKAMQDCTRDEFTSLIGILCDLKISKFVSGGQVVAEIITEQAGIDKPFNPNDAENIDKFIMCVKTVSPFFSKFIPANSYMSYLCTEVLPHLANLAAVVAEDLPSAESDLLQALAELSSFVYPENTNKPIDIAACQKVILNQILAILPSPPAEVSTESESLPSVPLKSTEALLVAFYQLGKHDASALNDEAVAKDLKQRLQFLARIIINEIKKIREAQEAEKKEKKPQNQEHLASLKSCSNIQAIIRDLHHVPPLFKSTLSVSWKTLTSNKAPQHAPAADENSASKGNENESANGATTAPSTNPKRKSIEAPDNSKPAKKPTTERQLYAPPKRGSYTYSAPGYRGGRGGGRGGIPPARGANRGRYSKRFN